MALETSEKPKTILALGDIIHHQRSLIGRDTCVVLVCSSTWPDRDLVVKISWPSIHRDSEKKLMDAAKAKADEIAGEGKRHWIVDHLPSILQSQNFRSNDEDPSQRRLVELLSKAEYADGKPFIYEEHLLRIPVSERLFPMTDLTDVKDIAQVFYHIFRCHHWLYEIPKILHRDMSLNNMMYRKRYDNSEQKFKVLGVLNDFDLSCSSPLKEATSLQRIGTPPYMAHELLDQSDVSHLYRHDVEAFYYVLLMLCCRHEIVQSAEGKVMKDLSHNRKDLPFGRWYDRTMSWETLAAAKFSFFFGIEPISPSKSFSAFLPWLNELRYLFAEGIHARTMWTHRMRQQSPSDDPTVPFDKETLGGYIVPTGILETISTLDGHSLSD
ncbi:hypothetical protein IW261DRAFT_1595246 [Armillaria novae-zelandiae]|uniref:Protein kinase domain-containing protein n=1 Tax=Armillaria novae-zelandiae TaxID=153914 RepID=A0AA39P1B5_9AGAR|nr:hypothetical protein IW261DRAFT_1595246 [Armillaria novae-zelandiae]